MQNEFAPPSLNGPSPRLYHRRRERSSRRQRGDGGDGGDGGNGGGGRGGLPGEGRNAASGPRGGGPSRLVVLAVPCPFFCRASPSPLLPARLLPRLVLVAARHPPGARPFSRPPFRFGLSLVRASPRGLTGRRAVKGGPTRCGGQAHPRLHYAAIGRQHQGRGAPSATVAADYLLKPPSLTLTCFAPILTGFVEKRVENANKCSFFVRKMSIRGLNCYCICPISGL